MLQDLFDDVVARNPGEDEFHQAVREVFDSLGPAVRKRPEYAEASIVRRMCEPERQLMFRVKRPSFPAAPIRVPALG